MKVSGRATIKRKKKKPNNFSSFSRHKEGGSAPPKQPRPCFGRFPRTRWIFPSLKMNQIGKALFVLFCFFLLLLRAGWIYQTAPFRVERDESETDLTIETKEMRALALSGWPMTSRRDDYIFNFSRASCKNAPILFPCARLFFFSFLALLWKGRKTRRRKDSDKPGVSN